MTSLQTSALRLTLAAGFAALTAADLGAQSYSLIDLTPNAGNGVAAGISGGIAAGYVSSSVFGTSTHAMLWDSTGASDLHPAQLDDLATGANGRSAILDISGNLQVGWGAGASTANRSVPLLWRGSAGTVATLAIPFTTFGGQALATDGSQIVGYATSLNRDGTTLGANHAMLWDAATGTPIDLGNGGGGAQANGVGGGQQVGYVIKSLANAALWKGSSKALTVLHPTGAVTSFANATDGIHQVGYAGYDLRVRVEAVKGQKDSRFYYAMVWSGSASSAINIHPYPINNLPGVTLSHSYAVGISGDLIVGYAGDQSKFGTPAYSHAIVWNADYQAVDLNEFLPQGFVGAQATSVDANGVISGFMSKADGTRHAVIWIRTLTN